MPFDVLRDDSRFSIAIRDPVWKHVWLTPEFQDITRSPDFLRLYRIRQLGPTEYVYPGATHTRAAHSIGVYHVAQRLIRVLLSRGADAWVTETGCFSFLAAALLHHLGHFPFTHSLKELPLVDHETLTGRVILSPRLAPLLAAAGADPEMTAAIVDGELPCADATWSETAFFRRLLSGVLDPDKLDYLNRDAYYCGVPYGLQDTDFILSRVYPDRENGLIIDSRAIMSIESILFSKYLMYRSVYWHRQVRIATAMMKKALYAALDRRLVSPEALYTLDDEGIYALVDRLDFPEKEAAAAIRNRLFYQTVAEFPFSSDNPKLCELEDLARRTEAERSLAEFLSSLSGIPVDASRVLIDIPERISFDSDLPVSDEGVPFSKSSTVFTGDLVGRFTSSLRIVRIAVHPDIRTRLPENPGLAETLARCLEVAYTQIRDH